MEIHRKMTKTELLEMINDYPDDAMFVLTTDFTKENPISDLGKIEEKSIVSEYARNSKTIIYSGNDFISHVDIHSVKQPDIENIQPAGIMRTIMVSP